jgi:hypothetical protein
MSVFSALPPVPSVAMPTPQVFAQEIVRAGHPVLIKGLAAHWPAVSRARQGDADIADYLKSFETGKPTLVLESASQTNGRFAYASDMSEFNFSRRNKTLSEGVDDIVSRLDQDDAAFIYIQSTPTPQYLPGFAEQNANPLLPPAVAPRIWISNATRAQTHNDNADNIACVVAGRRRFTLFPPEQLVNLYIGPMEHTPSGRAISLASLEEPDFDRFPKLAEALKHAQSAEMEPGDALFIPRYWWHHVQSLSAFNVLINYWWGNSTPTADNALTPFLAALLALKDVSPADKLYWKTMFDYYIFQTDGDPVAHIPQGHQGGLGPHNAKIRSSILKALQALVNAGTR